MMLMTSDDEEGNDDVVDDDVVDDDDDDEANVDDDDKAKDDEDSEHRKRHGDQTDKDCSAGAANSRMQEHPPLGMSREGYLHHLGTSSFVTDTSNGSIESYNTETRGSKTIHVSGN